MNPQRRPCPEVGITVCPFGKKSWYAVAASLAAAFDMVIVLIAESWRRLWFETRQIEATVAGSRGRSILVRLVDEVGWVGNNEEVEEYA